VTDTVKIVNAVGQITGAADRSTLRTVQTPQAFSLPLILDAHRRAAAAGLDDFTDDAAVATWAGYPVHVVDGDPDNFKVTTMADFIRAEAQLLADRPDIRVGQGFDVHAFAPGDHVWLGGVRIPHDKTLDGHSDADVVIHAICDAIYGALADGDIGAHFPPSDPRWRGVASELFLRHAVERVAARDGMIAHVDAAIVCEAPRIGPHRDAMRERLAAIMGVSLDRVAIKATTSEKLGFTGRREGIAVLTTVTLRLPLRA
jgi:2-C-methyl-D-erythritol 4-phosphate cytidylyltransferase/2-C-methyl-D-erythritol 2,4-cyclodiphosphate synthase